ncbi:hypothetical protein BHE74_00048303 [Ensete ventricosum]|nr:hypothetical protein GW17_00053779 [Ensete ventricosum]RWW45833.1 hypothetical protein BHE74_00048303 [Ensete ventricosum]
MPVKQQNMLTTNQEEQKNDDSEIRKCIHLIETNWSEGRLHNVGNRLARHHCPQKNARQQETGLTLAYPRDQRWMEREKDQTILGADVLARLPFSQDVGRLRNDRHREPRKGAEGRRRLNPRFALLLLTNGERSSEGEERESGQQLAGASAGRGWVGLPPPTGREKTCHRN